MIIEKKIKKKIEKGKRGGYDRCGKGFDMVEGNVTGKPPSLMVVSMKMPWATMLLPKFLKRRESRGI